MAPEGLLYSLDGVSIPQEIRGDDGLPDLRHQASGARLLQAWLGDGGHPLFYLSPAQAGTTVDTLLIGGVPVLFPEFAGRGKLPRHGFVRQAAWQLMRDETSASGRTVTYSLNISPAFNAAWPHTARLILEMQVSQGALEVRFQVTNKGRSRFQWTGGLHPHFLVQDVRSCQLTGLAGSPVQDRLEPGLLVQPQDWALPATGGIDRVYDSCAPLVLSTGTEVLHIETTGFDQWVVSNPGEQDAGAPADLAQGDWSRFLCVQPVRAQRPVVMKPGEIFVGTLSVRLQAPKALEPVVRRKVRPG